MSRPTLKLPSKPAADKPSGRKPIRGGGLSRSPRPKSADAPAADSKPRRPPAPGGDKPRRPPAAAGAKPAFTKERSPARGPRPTSGNADRPKRPMPPRDSVRDAAKTPAAEGAPARARPAPTAPRPAADKESAPPRREAAAIPVWPGVSNSQPRPPRRADDQPAAEAPRPRRAMSAAKPAPRQPRPAPRPATRAATPPLPIATPTPAAEAPTPAAPTFARAGLPEQPRLSKRMSELGLCSRREADEWIENGWVKVDGVVTDTLGTRVSPKAKIEVDARAREHQSESVTILIHKPIGFVSGQAEDGYEPAVVLVRPENRWEEDNSHKEFKPGHLRGLAPAGRLDIDSTGLLVLTQDGRIARRLIGEDSDVEKEYLVRVEGTLAEDGIKLLNHGLSLDGVKLKPAKVSWQNEDQLRFVLREGKKRQIRRMCELVGLNVVGLKRVRIGSVVLGKLPVGAWRYLRFDEKF